MAVLESAVTAINPLSEPPEDSKPFAEPASAKEAASEAPQDEPVDTPFKPVALTPTDSSSSPFTKGEPGGLPQRTELPPKKEITAPAGQHSPFEPGEAPSFENPDSNDQDKLDKILRQFKERYGRK